MELKYVAVLLTQILLPGENQRYTYADPLTGHGVRNAVEMEFPFVVSIGNPKKSADERHFCTGALISPWHVLTAAHCFRKKKPKTRLQVTIGSVDLREGTVFFSEDWITYDQRAKENGECIKHEMNDVAIMKLMNETMTIPATFWSDDNKELYGKSATLAGWGRTNDGNKPQILQVAKVTIPSNEECSDSRNSCSIKPRDRAIHSRLLCSKADPYVHTGHGDSGGPLIYENNTIIGVNGGRCPSDKDLNPNLEPDFINKHRFNEHPSTSFYQKFINHCLEHF